MNINDLKCIINDVIDDTFMNRIIGLNADLFPFSIEKFWEGDDGKQNGYHSAFEFFNKPTGKQLAHSLIARYAVNEDIYPAQENIFRAFQLTKLKDVKVVILGQDPYPDDRADGLCFSQRHHNEKKDSLSVILDALRNEKRDDKEYYLAQTRSLEQWAKRGILLLNSILTVGHKPLTHDTLGWDEFTDEVIRVILKNKEDKVVFALWGDKAYNKFNRVLKKYNKVNDKHIEISKVAVISEHPSPRNNVGFKAPFTEINRKIGEEINWNLE